MKRSGINLKNKNILLGIICFSFLGGVAGNANAEKCQVRDQDISATYKGGCKDGQAEGKGTAKGKDAFVGIFHEGDKVKGTYTWANGNVYTGEFKNDAVHGQGEMKYAGGGSYKGEWVNGKKHGQGEMKYANGDSYKGQWANSVPVGPTKFQEKECMKEEDDFIKSKCGEMITDNYICISDQKDFYRKTCASTQGKRDEEKAKKNNEIKSKASKRLKQTESTLIDTEAKLEWAKHTLFGKNYSAIVKGIENMNSDKFAGHNDWRIPKTAELTTLSKYIASINPRREAYGQTLDLIGINNSKYKHPPVYNMLAIELCKQERVWNKEILSYNVVAMSVSEVSCSPAGDMKIDTLPVRTVQ